ncbi:thioredoxin-domain-containing protein [Favolaschia claudopus]|uniref:Thioredoxin-domain-containing protein n=1 Tax=Favolaschia claudopus TaxID=2862362 RepID=A0AAW0D8U8_9AGAR
MLATVTGAIQQALSSPSLLRRHIPVAKRPFFALDLALIALGCRCAWLVDVTVVQDAEQVYADFLRFLCQGHGAIFENVRHIYEASSQQSFFFNTQLCRELVRSISDDTAYVRFVFLKQHGEPELLKHPPPDVLSALLTLSETQELPPSLAQHTLIPLAGVLLGYPVAYVPDSISESSTFLAQVPLDVYTCHARSPSWTSPHTFLKFSCPAVLVDREQIVASLMVRFEPRLDELGIRLDVAYSREVMDRVAL